MRGRRPAELEGEATWRAIKLALVAKAPLYVVHLSSRPALEAVAEARSRGQNTFAETCPQYLFLSEDDLDRPGFEGAKFVCTPPLRPKEHQADLWRGLRTDQLSVVSTDHCPFCYKEQKELGLGNFTKIPNGLPGVENRMDLIYQGVVAGEISLSRWVEVTSTAPAKMFGLHPKKGDDRPRLRRRHRRLRPGGAPDHLGIDPPHGSRLLLLRGDDHQREGGSGLLERPPDHRRRVLPGVAWRRAVRQALALPGPGLNREVPMDIGLVLQTDPPARSVVARAVEAEDAGFSHVWTFDSCVLWQEPFVVYAQILAATSKLVVGPMVTNPATRDWSVTASLFATLNDTFGNRTVCGIGRGDSALRVIGRKPAPMSVFAESITAIKELAEGRDAVLNGTAVRLNWASKSRLPIWGAGYGPQALRVIGERADGFILQLADPEIARWTIGAVRSAAAAAGRDPAALSICVAAPAYVGEDLDHQHDQLRWFGGMVGNHVADIVSRYGDSSDVPAALTEYVAGRSGYDYSHHGKADNPEVGFVSDEIVDRFCLTGPSSSHVERLRRLADLGVDQFALYLMHDGADATFDAYRAEVIPAVSRP